MFIAVTAVAAGAAVVMQTAMGFNIQNPTGQTSNELVDVTLLGGATKMADVFLTDTYQNYTDAQRTAIATNFVLSKGGGLVLGGQGW